MFAKRDVFALLLSCFAVYYSTLSEGVVSFHPAFVVARDVGPGETAWDAPGFLSGRFDGRSDVDDPTDNRNANKRDDHPPPPQFFDLNGDGVREMLVATGGSGSGDEPQLRMVEMSREDIGGNKGRDRQRRRANANSYSRATEDVLAGERGVRGGAQSFFGSADAFERARVLARVSLAQPPPRGGVGDSDKEHEEREETDEHERERSFGVSFGSRAPIALGVGAVRPASFKNASSSVASKKNIRRSSLSNSRNGSRKGVVVVVTEGWHVVCFDHNLRVMWERALGEDFPRHAKPREAAVLVTAAAVFEGDRGTVIVGGRVDSGVIDEESDVFGSFDPLNAELERERAVRTRAGGDASRSSAAEASSSSNAKSARHFNYYAFETGTGEIRWTHESDDFHRDVRGLADALVPQHDHKLDAAARAANEGRHFGEAACREFRESVVRFATPHRWTGREDTSFVLARFQHHKEASSSKARKKNAPVEGGPPFFRDDGDFEAELDEDAFPNVFVAHQEEGIEVVHLFGGRTVCKMLLTPLDAHADVNGDGVLEHVSARGGGGAGAGGGLDAAGEMFLDEQKGGQKTKHHDRNCWARVSAGTPPRGVVFEGSICRGSMGVTRHKRRDGGGADDANAGGFISGNTVEVVSPVALRRPQDSSRRAERAFSEKRNARRSETLRDGSAGDRSRRDKETKRQRVRFSPPNAVFDLVFLNSRGEMTSYTHEGVRRWQQRTDSGWARGSGETPSFFSFPLRRRVGSRDSETEVALAVGATRATFVTPSGYVLATLKLPARPIAPVLIEDVNGDGLNDVVLRTERGVFAWTQKSRVGAKPFSVLAGALCLLVGGVFLAQVAHAHSSGMKRLVRSTDMDDFEGRKER
jgi:hypothetical protein